VNQVQIRILASGVYPLPVFPPELARAMEENVKQHMTAYGFKDVMASAEDVPEEWMYELGIASPGGFEFVRRTTSKTEADAWVSTPAAGEWTQNVYQKKAVVFGEPNWGTK
jgi:hypothetical protein